MTTCGSYRLHPMPMRRAKLSGFTLTELLITVAVLGVLATIAVPSFREFIAGQRIKTASFDVMAALTLARSEAIKRSASVTAPVTVSPAGGAWANGWSVAAPGGAALTQQGALTGLTVTCKQGTPAATVACPASGLAYQGNGRLVAAVPSLEIGGAASNLVRCISIDLSGRPIAKAGGC